VASTSTALFVVEGNIEIEKTVETVGVALFTDQSLFTAYNLEEGQSTNTLFLKGLFSANKISFQRTLQGTDNNNDPSEDFTYEPKYLVALKDYLGNDTVKWLTSK